MIRSAFFSEEGHGYIVDGDMDEIYQSIADRKEYIKHGFHFIPGKEYTLNGFFDRTVEFAGINKENEDLTVWYLGKSNTLFGDRHYFLEILMVSGTRIAIAYGPGFGRDFNFLGGVWK